MPNKVWFCRVDPDDYEGVYIGHHNRDKAKSLAANELGCTFVEVSMEMIKGETTEHTGVLPRAEIERIAGTTMVEA